MKKILALILVLCCALTFCACNKTQPTEPTTPPESIEDTTPIETEPEPTLDPEKEAKQALFEEIFTNKQYIIGNEAMRAAMTSQHNVANFTAIKNENKMLYSIGGILVDGYVEADLYQNENNEIFFHKKTAQAETENEIWYKCSKTEGYDIATNLFDISFFRNALDQIEAVEYVATENHIAHIIVYSNMKAEGHEESDARTVFDVFIDDETLIIDSIHYYDDSREWMISFVSPEQAVLAIPENIAMEEIDVKEAQQQMDDIYNAVLTIVEPEEDDHEHEHTHPTEKADIYPEKITNSDYIINWDSIRINIEDFLVVEKHKKDGATLEIASAPDSNKVLSVAYVTDTSLVYTEKVGTEVDWCAVDDSLFDNLGFEVTYYEFMYESIQSLVEQIVGGSDNIVYETTENNLDVVKIVTADDMWTMTWYINPENNTVKQIKMHSSVREKTYVIDFISYKESDFDIPAADTVSNHITLDELFIAQMEFVEDLGSDKGIDRNNFSIG